MKPMTPNELLGAISLSQDNDARIVFDVFTSFGSYIQKKDFKDIEEILAKVDPTKVSSHVSLTILTATHVCKDKLRNRDSFHEKTTKHFAAIFKDEKDCLPLLEKLK